MSASEYIRVGTNLFRIVDQPMPDGKTKIKRIPWKLSTFRADHSKDEVADIPKYNGFCIVPSHENYQREINSFYNIYEPVDHEPVEGEWPHIENLIKHIFAEQYEMGLDYLQLLYQEPLQDLPILMLVSVERATGKSTFLNFLKALFKENATFCTNESFHSQFNSDWADKLLVMIDETSLNRREDSERLKNLSTAKSIKSEAKGENRIEIEFFGKFVLCSNNEFCPLFIDDNEIRYWVRKVPVLQIDDTGFLQKCIDEIPAFLWYLKQRALTTRKESRMWFGSELLQTEALRKIVRANRSFVEIEMAEILRDIMDEMQVSIVEFTVGDLIPILNYHNVRAENHQIRKVLNEFWKLRPAANTLSYTCYKLNFPANPKYSGSRSKGRFYTVTYDLIKSILI